MNYLDTSTNQVVTRTLMDYKGLPKDETVLRQLGYVPIIYEYLSFDADLTKLVPNNDLVLENGYYVQRFQITDLDFEALKASLERVVKNKISEVKAQADEAIKPLTENYSDTEKQTWSQQQIEVKAYLADNSIATPMLDALASARGLSRETMLEKAINKINTFERTAVAIIGKQRTYETNIQTIADNTEMSLSERIKKIRSLLFSYNIENTSDTSTDILTYIKK